MGSMKAVLMLACVGGVVAMLLACGGGGGVSAVFPPRFSLAGKKSNHRIFEAQWFITLKNNGGPGSQLVKFWVGSRENPKHRETIYSERHQLGGGESKTITVTWKHNGVGAFWNAATQGSDDDIEFLP